MSITHISGIQDIIENYDTFLIDQWGVMHNGVQALPFATACLRQIREAGKHILILSNSGKREASAAKSLTRMGFSRDWYDHIVTSGEYLHSCLADKKGAYKSLGLRVALWAPLDHTEIMDGTDFELVDQLEDADFILCTATTMATIEDYQPLLERALVKGIPFICGNPDLVSLNPDGRLVMCPGRVALTYQEMGGKVLWSGKPYAGMYERCLELMPTALDKVIGIGDSLHHDIKGASDFGVASCLITTGVHAKALNTAFAEGYETQVEDLCAREDIYPTYTLPYFQWSAV